jgi:hypothetical protein
MIEDGDGGIPCDLAILVGFSLRAPVHFYIVPVGVFSPSQAKIQHSLLPGALFLFLLELGFKCYDSRFEFVHPVLLSSAARKLIAAAEKSHHREKPSSVQDRRVPRQQNAGNPGSPKLVGSSPKSWAEGYWEARPR